MTGQMSAFTAAELLCCYARPCLSLEECLTAARAATKDDPERRARVERAARALDLPSKSGLKLGDGPRQWRGENRG